MSWEGSVIYSFGAAFSGTQITSKKRKNSKERGIYFDSVVNCESACCVSHNILDILLSIVF